MAFYGILWVYIEARTQSMFESESKSRKETNSNCNRSPNQNQWPY